MKRLTAVLALVALMALAFASQAAQFAYTNLGITNNVPNNTTTTDANVAKTINCARYGQVALHLKYELDGSGTTACTFKFASSVDGSNYPTTPDISIAFVPNGTTAVITNTVIDIGPRKSLKLISVTAANNTAAMTNIVVGYAFKPNRLDGK